jgi:hypothetical protein
VYVISLTHLWLRWVILYLVSFTFSSPEKYLLLVTKKRGKGALSPVQAAVELKSHILWNLLVPKALTRDVKDKRSKTAG